MTMNTSAVASALNVSQSTIQRWVKQLDLQMERNELGHYFFTEKDVYLLKQVQEQLNSGIALQDVTVKGKKSRKGSTKSAEQTYSYEKLIAKISDLEVRLNAKADDVVAYQLLQHRLEIEEMQKEIAKLTEKIAVLEEEKTKKTKQIPADALLMYDNEKPRKKTRKKKILTMLFGF